ncbi:hypothetical protein NL676_025856 [Syzygium grande]|nr:hypothetical protein NL676_025856 [Syzygium grande]
MEMEGKVAGMVDQQRLFEGGDRKNCTFDFVVTTAIDSRLSSSIVIFAATDRVRLLDLPCLPLHLVVICLLDLLGGVRVKHGHFRLLWSRRKGPTVAGVVTVTVRSDVAADCKEARLVVAVGNVCTHRRWDDERLWRTSKFACVGSPREADAMKTLWAK